MADIFQACYHYWYCRRSCCCQIICMVACVRLFADSSNEPTPPQVHDSTPQAAYVTLVRYSMVQ